jgi:phage tail-like protein
VVEWDAEEVKEGGLNTFTHMLPGRLKPARITLKNGIGKNKLLDWYVDSMNQKFTRKTVTISILDSYRKPIQTWNIKEACPVKLTGPDLRSDSNTIAIQSLEFLCGEVTVS